MTINILNMTERSLREVTPLSYVTDGENTGRFFGVTKRGVVVIAWGDKRDDYDTAEKLIQYVQDNQ